MADMYTDNQGRIVQAMLVSPELAVAIAAWCKGLVVEEIDAFHNDIRQPGVNVPTDDRVKRASVGDYVVKYEDGTFEVFTPNLFAQLHELGSVI